MWLNFIGHLAQCKAEYSIRKKINQEKISNNSLVEIDNMSPLELLKLQVTLKKIILWCICYVSADRTDYNTLLPVLELHKAHLETYPKEAYKNNIGKYVNMTKVEGGYLCKNNRLIAFDGTQKIKSKG